MLNRQEALDLVRKYIKNENTIKHCLASEAVMKGLANKLGQDETKWGIAGLLHDLDYEQTKDSPQTHGAVTAEILKQLNVDPEIIEAIYMHNEMVPGTKRTTAMHYALAAGETITGLITAVALVYPDKKIAQVKPSSITKRMKEKSFAASVNRDVIMECTNLDIPLEQFVDICLTSMKTIAEDLGL